MKQVKANVYELEGYAITVDVKGNIEEYAMNFLHIVNNVRDNKNSLKKVANHYNNDVTVYCIPEAKDNLIKYLKGFGEIKSCESVLMYQIEELDYDIDKYEDAIIISEFE